MSDTKPGSVLCSLHLTERPFFYPHPQQHLKITWSFHSSFAFPFHLWWSHLRWRHDLPLIENHITSIFSVTTSISGLHILHCAWLGDLKAKSLYSSHSQCLETDTWIHYCHTIWQLLWERNPGLQEANELEGLTQNKLNQENLYMLCLPTNPSPTVSSIFKQNEIN